MTDDPTPESAPPPVRPPEPERPSFGAPDVEAPDVEAPEIEPFGAEAYEAGAPPRLPDPEEVERQRYRRLEVLKDNLEAFTVALVMALVIKHFCVEAFKIPTGSMMPTLYGEKNSPRGVGDRILVDKWAYVLRDPQRWDVVVFRYPMNQSKHFIKRVGGVGGEWIKIARGDVWSRRAETDPWRIAAKRRRARDELYLPVYPPRSAAEDAWFHAEMPAATEYWEPEGAWRVTDYQTLDWGGGPAGTITLRQRIGSQSSPDDYDMDVSRSDLVADARFLMRVVPNAPGVLTLRWQTADDAVAELRLAPEGDAEGSFVRTRRGDVDVAQPLPARIVGGRALRLELEYVDGQVWAWVDGTAYGPLDEGRQLDDLRDLDDFTQRFSLEAEGGSLRIEDLRIERDVHYVTKSMPGLSRSGDGVRVPDGHYFMLGDNTEGSSDSRQWELSGIVLKDGREIWYEASSSDNSPHRDHEGFYRVVDKDGVERRWRREDEETRDRRPSPFVPRDVIVGRAFFIFWPVLPDFPGRAGFIH